MTVFVTFAKSMALVAADLDAVVMEGCSGECVGAVAYGVIGAAMPYTRMEKTSTKASAEELTKQRFQRNGGSRFSYAKSALLIIAGGVFLLFLLRRCRKARV